MRCSRARLTVTPIRFRRGPPSRNGWRGASMQRAHTAPARAPSCRLARPFPSSRSGFARCANGQTLDRRQGRCVGSTRRRRVSARAVASEGQDERTCPPRRHRCAVLRLAGVIALTSGTLPPTSRNPTIVATISPKHLRRSRIARNARRGTSPRGRRGCRTCHAQRAAGRQGLRTQSPVKRKRAPPSTISKSRGRIACRSREPRRPAQRARVKRSLCAVSATLPPSARIIP